MSFESKLIAALLNSRDDYEHVKQHINEEALSLFGKVIMDNIADYYSRDEDADSVDLEILRMALDRRFADIPKHQDKVRDLLEEILSTDTSSINIVHEVVAQRRAEKGMELADALFTQDNERIAEHWAEYADMIDATSLSTGVEEEYTNVSLDTIEAGFKETGVWQLAPLELSRRIRGGLRAGHAVIVAARPERGKTLFGVNFMTGFLQQGAKVLGIINEDPVPDVVLRVLSNLTGLPEELLFEDKELAMRLAREKNYANLTLAGLSPGTLWEVEALIRRHKPDCVVVDQMRNIRAASENNTQRLEQVAQELRNMARRHECVMIEMTQVGDSGRDKLILNDGDIDGSNTGIPGACDVIIMIGSNDDFELRDMRKITLAKNKRGGDHGNFNVSVDRQLSRVYTHAEVA